MQSDSEWSDVNDVTSAQWEVCSAASEKAKEKEKESEKENENENENENEIDHEDVASIHSSDFDESTNANNNSNMQRHISVVDQSIDENEILLVDPPNALPISTTLHNVNIAAELESQRQEIQRLREELGLAQSLRDEALQRMEELKEERNLERSQLIRLRETNGSIAQQNVALRNMLSKQQQHQVARMQKKMNQMKRENKSYQRPTIPAKLRFRRARTTHRSVFNRVRKL